MNNSKKILFIFRHAPHVSLQTQEGLDMLLLAGAYQLQTSVLFLDDAIFSLKNQQHPEKILRKALHKTFCALPVYDIENIFVDELSLSQRGMSEEDLILTAQIISESAIAELFAQQDVIIGFG